MTELVDILFRAGLAEEVEMEAARRHFPVITSRAEARSNTLIIPRYSLLPYPEELQRDVELLGAKLINTTRQHRYVADLANWYGDFAELTPKTWFRLSDVPSDHPGPFVLKGATNSRKNLWGSHMFAATRAAVMPVALRLMDDSMIGAQGIYVREYEPFTRFGSGLQGLPISNEWRCFILDGEVIATGFYWSESLDEVIERHGEVLTNSKGWAQGFAMQVADRLKNRIRFVVADVAQRTDGEWRLVELNDGCMSGLSAVDPDALYRALRRGL